MKRSALILGSLLSAAVPSSIQAAVQPLSTPNLATIEYPDGAPPSAAEVALGRQLYFETRLSGNGTMSCATCHNPDAGLGDGMAKGVGSTGNKLGRNTPHVYNLAWSTVLFWDGRAGSLEEQALGPIAAPGEMNLPIPEAVARLQAIPGYREQFSKVYGAEGIKAETLGKAIAAFERTLVSRNSPFDRHLAGDKTAMSPEAVRGLALYQGKANCLACHNGPNFTDDSFHNLGMKDDDPGRGKLDAAAHFQGAFKTPGLRNTALTAPYMHDGSLPTLEAVVQYYNRGGDIQGKDPLIKPLQLNEGEVRDLVAFLGALTDPVKVDAPVLP
jgi:cytochrome c peroxidase